MGTLDTLRLLVLLSARSLRSHRTKSLIVGGILAFGTLLLVLGNTFLDNTGRRMKDSITGSLVGDLQVHSAEGKDALVFYGPAASSQQDLGVLTDFPKVRQTLQQVPGVKAVVPMGRDVATGVGGNPLDELLGELRRAVAGGQTEQVRQLIPRVRKIAELMQTDYQNRLAISSDAEEVRAKIDVLSQVMGDDFWARFDTDPLPQLDFLDTRIAPLQSDEAVFFLAYVGTDIEAFRTNFPRFQIVTGQAPPPGERGFLFSNTFYEETAKNAVARTFDTVHKACTQEGKTIAGDPKLQELVKRTARQYRQITWQLGPDDASAIESAIDALIPGQGGDLNRKLEGFLQLDDANFTVRHDFFYKEIAPRIRLYKLRVGDTITLRAYTRSGYARAVNVKVWGTFKFEGLDGSILASRYNVMDLMTFRDLYGLMTPERRQELDAIKAQVGAQDVSRDSAEADLFGGDPSALEAQGTTGTVDTNGTLDTIDRDARARPFTQADIDNGVVLTAAVVLDDAVSTEQGLRRVQEAADRAGLQLKAVDWMQVSGVIGQFVLVIRIVLYAAIGIIFLVALIIINNAMLMATMDRVTEIGTLRAIGAQRGFVRAMFLLETTLLALLSSGLGLGVAAALIGWLHKVGLPAGTDILIVLYGGNRLYPELTAGSAIGSVLLILGVGVAATLYPAVLATRIQPIVALQRRE